MADLNRNTADLPTVIVGATTAGVATTPVGADSSGNMYVNAQVVAAPTDYQITGTLTSGSSSVILTGINAASSVNVDVSGPGFVGVIMVQETYTSSSRSLPVQGLATGAFQSSITANGNYRVFGIAATTNIQVIFSSYTSGSATITIRSSAATNIVQATQLNAANLLASAYMLDGVGNSIGSSSGYLNVNTKSVRTFSAPTTASVGTTSTLILAANPARKGLYLSNTTSTQQVSFGFDGNAAAYQNGITLYPGEKFYMDEYSFSQGAIYAITSGSTAYIGVQEIT